MFEGVATVIWVGSGGPVWERLVLVSVLGGCEIVVLCGGLVEGINMGRHRLMHLPKPMGPYHVSFADFELRRTPGSAEQSEGDAGVEEDVEKGAVGAEGAPLMRFFYPTAAEPKWSPPDTQTRRWLPHFNYTWGFFSKIIIPSSFLRRFIIWALSCMHVSLIIYCKNICCLPSPIDNHTCSYVQVLRASIL